MKTFKIIIITCFLATAVLTGKINSNGITGLDEPVKYSYDPSGNRTGKNVIGLKSGRLANTNDSTDVFSNDFNLPPFEDNINGDKIIIYPNPTRGSLKIEVPGFVTTTNTSIQLFDFKGSLLISQVLGNTTSTLDLSTFSNGTYVLKIIIGDKVSEWKIIKE